MEKMEKQITKKNSSIFLSEMRQGMDEEKQKRELLQKFISDQLVEGVDYGVIEMKTSSGKQYKTKPTLLKSGGEKFISILNLRPEWKKDEETYSMLPISVQKAGAICYICLLVNPKNVVLSEGRGGSRLDESRIHGDINKAIKLAKKRAMMDAVLGLGLSDSFTCDLEDMNTNEDVKREVGINKPIWFGSHKGIHFIDLDYSYLEWCRDVCDITKSQAKDVQEVIDAKMKRDGYQTEAEGKKQTIAIEQEIKNKIPMAAKFESPIDEPLQF